MPTEGYKDKKYSLNKKNLRYRRKLNDALNLEDSDLSEGNASSSSSSSESEDNETASNASENEDSDGDGSSHCSEDEDDHPAFQVDDVDKVSMR